MSKKIINNKKEIENKYIIEVNNLTKKFGDVIANNNITFKIKKGERLAIIGANGAGKTTLVEQLIGVSKPTSGEIKYNFKFNKTPQEKMGMQFQDSSYPDGLSVKDIIDFSLEVYASDIPKKVLKEMLKKFQVEKFYKSKAKGLSGGQQQKLNVLLAILHHPEIVVLDEISTGLDISAREEIVSYIDGITKKDEITTILISHQMSEVERLCSRVIFLESGKVKFDEPIKNIISKYGSLDAFSREIIRKEIESEK